MKIEQRKSRLYIMKSAASRLPDEPGIYILFQGNGILVYIGKANSLRNRVMQHDGNKNFTRIGYEPLHYSRARKREKELLEMYVAEHGQLPYYNKQS